MRRTPTKTEDWLPFALLLAGLLIGGAVAYIFTKRNQSSYGIMFERDEAGRIVAIYPVPMPNVVGASGFFTAKAIPTA